MNFVYTDGGYINLAFVAQVKGLGGNRYSLIDQHGESFGRGEFDPDSLSSQVIPAAPGFRAVHYFVEHDDDGSVEWVDEAPVIAWRIGLDGAWPVISGDSLGVANYAVVDPSGAVRTFDGERFDGVDEWKDSQRIRCARKPAPATASAQPE